VRAVMRRFPLCCTTVFIVVCVLLTVASADAQIAAEFAGGGALAAADNYGEFDHGFVPTASVDVFGERSGFGGHISIDFPRTMTREEPGRIKSGPVVYIWTRSDRKTSFLVRGEALSAHRVGFAVRAGITIVTTRTTSRYSFQRDNNFVQQQTTPHGAGASTYGRK
jgi:hypothetical protein